VSNQVYANNMEVSCKAADGKTICAMPDVCMTPPQTPATPPGVPVPYPNTGMASDCSDGSSTVKISGQEAMLKNKSFFKKSTGDEAGSAPMKGVITATTTGKVYFIVWSMDVQIEGENVVRHLDMTTGNHACPTPNAAAPFTYAQRMAMGDLKECAGDKEKVGTACNINPDDKEDTKKRPGCPSNAGIKKAEKARASAKKRWGKGSKGYKNANENVSKEYEDFGAAVKHDKCHKALKCFLSPQKPSRCCKGQTPHHLIPASAIVEEGGRNAKGGESVLSTFPDYQSNKAPCMCVEGPNAQTATHGRAHVAWSQHVSSLGAQSADLSYTKGAKVNDASTMSYGQAVEGARKTAKAVAPHCDPACIAAQVNKEHLDTTEPSDAQNATPVRRTMDLDGEGADHAAN
jgi:Domain of unknown function (DUF4150)/GHH signature containing HNH/Endo VII superfamily nuclease toxin  2